MLPQPFRGLIWAFMTILPSTQLLQSHIGSYYVPIVINPIVLIILQRYTRIAK